MKSFMISSQPQDPPHASARDQGFTLIEVLVVIVILGVILGLSAPNLSRSYYHFLLDQTADHMAYLLRYAQSRAILQNNAYRLVIHKDQNKYWLEEEVSGVSSKGQSRSFSRLSGKLGRVVAIPSEMRFQGEVDTLLLEPDGTIEKARFFFCVREDCLTLSTQEQMGYVHVYKSEEIPGFLQSPSSKD